MDRSESIRDRRRRQSPYVPAENGSAAPETTWRPAGVIGADRVPVQGLTAAQIVSLQRLAGNRATAATIVRNTRMDRVVPTGMDVQRNGKAPPVEPVYGGAIVGMHNVPAGLRGRALKVHVVARHGKITSAQAAELVDRFGIPAGGVDRRANGAVVFGLTPREEALILRISRREGADQATEGPTSGERESPQPASAERPQAGRSAAEAVARTVGDVGTDLAPVISNVKDATIAVTGINPVTGERVGTAGRIASAIFAIPVIGNLAKYVGKGSRWLWKGLRLLTNKLGARRLAQWLKGKWAKLTGKGRVALKGAVVVVDERKFSEYIFKEGATHGKDKVFRSLGYGPEHSKMLAQQYQKQAAERYAAGNYTLGKKDVHGQRIDIEISLDGIGMAQGKVSYLRSGWMIRPDGSLSLNTPFSGFIR